MYIRTCRLLTGTQRRRRAALNCYFHYCVYLDIVSRAASPDRLNLMDIDTTQLSRSFYIKVLSSVRRNMVTEIPFFPRSHRDVWSGSSPMEWKARWHPRKHLYIKKNINFSVRLCHPACSATTSGSLVVISLHQRNGKFYSEHKNEHKNDKCKGNL